MNIKKKILQLLIIASVLILFLGLTHPQNLPVGLLLIPFIILGVLSYTLLSLIFLIFRLFSGNKSRQKITALLFSLLLTNFAVLQSIGSVGIQDVLLAIAITVVVLVYVTKFQLMSE